MASAHASTSATHEHRRSSGHKRSAPPPAADVTALPTAAALFKSLANFDAFVADTLARLYVQPQSRVAELYCSQSSLSSRLMTDITADFHSSSSSAVPVGVSSVTIGNTFSIASYLGVDPDCSAPKQRWILNDCPFDAEWITADPAATALFADQDTTKEVTKTDAAASSSVSATASSLPSPLLSPSLRGSFDVVASFKSVSSKSMSSQAVLRCFLGNVAALLKPGGVWMGTCFDSQAIWYKITKREREGGPQLKVHRHPQRRRVGGHRDSRFRVAHALLSCCCVVQHEPGVGVLVRGPGYTLDCPHLPRSNASFSAAFSMELRVYLQLTGGSSASASTLPPVMPGVLVHFPTLVAEAEAFGLQLLRLQNYLDFHAELASELGAPEITQHTARKMKFAVKPASDSKSHATAASSSSTHLTAAQSDLYSLFTTFAFRKAAI